MHGETEAVRGAQLAGSRAANEASYPIGAGRESETVFKRKLLRRFGAARAGTASGRGGRASTVLVLPTGLTQTARARPRQTQTRARAAPGR